MKVGALVALIVIVLCGPVQASWELVGKGEKDGLEGKLRVISVVGRNLGSELLATLVLTNTSDEMFTVATNFEHYLFVKNSEKYLLVLALGSKMKPGGGFYKTSTDGLGIVMLYPGESCEITGLTYTIDPETFDESIEAIELVYSVFDDDENNYGDLWCGKLEFEGQESK
ncbi:MAG: hypothetical protein AAF591_12305 [Verrucomicrobiota bacterium]